jgi:hypothetical protein
MGKLLSSISLALLITPFFGPADSPKTVDREL